MDFMPSKKKNAKWSLVLRHDREQQTLRSFQQSASSKSITGCRNVLRKQLEVARSIRREIARDFKYLSTALPTKNRELCVVLQLKVISWRGRCPANNRSTRVTSLFFEGRGQGNQKVG